MRMRRAWTDAVARWLHLSWYVTTTTKSTERLRILISLVLSTDVDECRSDPGICGQGHCENSLGSFHCICEDGFSVRPELGPSCADEDECLMGNFICAPHADCVNSQV